MSQPSEDLEKNLQRIIETTRSFDKLQQMMRTSRSFDEEFALKTAQSEKAIADAFRKIIDRTYVLEKKNERAIRTGIRIQKLQSKNSKLNRSLSGKLINKLPSKYRNLPLAFRRNPRLVIKYFLGMLLGRLLAILLYLLAALIPAIPLPENIQGLVGKPIKAAGSLVGGVRGVLMDPAVIASTLSNIPTDINKLLQKIGEFFQFYGKRVWAFVLRAVLHPKLAYEDMKAWSRANVRFFVRLCRSAVAVMCSLVMIKLAMLFLLPLFGGVVITIMGLKISILLIVIVRMIFDKIGEFIGTKAFSKLSRKWRHLNETKKTGTSEDT